MVSKQEFKLVNAYDKLKVENAQRYQEQLLKLKTEVKPKDYQGIAMDGYIIFEGDYNPNAIVTYKVPRKIDYEFDKFPMEIREEIQRLQAEYNLTKKQLKVLRSQIQELNLKLDKHNKTLIKIINGIKEKEKNDKKLEYFDKLYSKFFESLSDDLALYDLETKLEIKKKLIKLVQLIEDTIKNYL
ncbi:MAG: hypothetical protein K0Q49_2364 [Haloplasmataceae bacterium]|jgi:hypothetical protein|nr:hypothetical protein [Haloplasmataceae bacterium]